MLHNALYDTYGEKKLKTEFTAFNKKRAYKSNWGDDYDLFFVRDYATTSFAEDFAETFMTSLYDSGSMRRAYTVDSDAALVKKSEYIKKIIESEFHLKINQNSWMIYPQKLSKKFKHTLQLGSNYGINYSNEGNYQYKIKKAVFYDELQYVLSNTDSNNLISNSDYVPKEDYSWGEYLKRKDLALILSDVMNFVNVTVKPSGNLTFDDCDTLSSKYKKSIKRVEKAGLMLSTKDNNFSPDSYCSYEQAYYALVKLYFLIQDNHSST